MQVDFGDGPETEHNLHLTSHPHAHSPAFSPFRHPAVPAIDPGLDHTDSASRNGHAPMPVHPQHPSSQHHLLQPDHALTTSHLSPSFYPDMSRPDHTPSTPSHASPRFAAVSPTSQPKHLVPPPSRDVSDDTIDDAYAAFILYCNPKFPPSTDTSELTRLFRTPPKSDGKEFSTWVLLELIRKFDAKEIKTWTQLVQDLGVSPPDTNKGQSTQKVQQYSVRLKRWMHAMHIDAFFEYLLGKQHPYYLQIPPPHEPFPENGRDGVPLEEDLAIRALDPKFRPKRGRRKADEVDEEMDLTDNTPPRKRPQLDTSIPFGNMLQPQSAYPHSAHPDSMDTFPSALDWASSAMTATPSTALTTSSAPSRMNPNKNLTPFSASPMTGQQHRWRLNSQDNPTTPHPLSAVTPQSAHPDFFDEPQSAVTPSSSKPRSRRRHGPAVSSAWPSSNNNSSGKLRGRPPSNRSVRDGPFVTFPANPKTKEGPTIDVNRNPGNLTPIVERAQSDPPVPEQHIRFPPTPASAISPNTMEMQGTQKQQQQQQQQQQQRPHRLSLQVPQNVGNPVRLVTPTVLVNGEQNPTPNTGLAPSAITTGSARDSPGTFFSSSPDHGQETPQHAHHPHQHPTPQSTHHPHHPHPHPTPQSAQPPSSSTSHYRHNNPGAQDLPPPAPPPPPPPPTAISPPPSSSSIQVPPSIPLESLNRALAAELLRAAFSGRKKRLRGSEAKNLASAILGPICGGGSRGGGGARVASEGLGLGVGVAALLGLGNGVGGGGSRSGGSVREGGGVGGGGGGGVKKVECRRFRVGDDGYESPVDEDEDEDGGGEDNNINNNSAEEKRRSDGQTEQARRRSVKPVKETFDIFFTISFGGLRGECWASGLSAASPPPLSSTTTTTTRSDRLLATPTPTATANAQHTASLEMDLEEEDDDDPDPEDPDSDSDDNDDQQEEQVEGGSPGERSRRMKRRRKRGKKRKEAAYWKHKYLDATRRAQQAGEQREEWLRERVLDAVL